MSIIRDAIDRLMKAGADERAVTMLKVPAEPSHIYYLVNHSTGQVTKHYADKQESDAFLHDLPSFARYVLKLSDKFLWHVWYSIELVTCQAPGIYEECSVEIGRSPEMKWLCDADESGGKVLTQAGIIHLFRTTFAKSASNLDALLVALRNVTFTASKETESTIDHGKTSIGKSARAELTNANAVPDVVIIECPVFSYRHAEELRTTAMVECAITIDPENENFKLTPLPGQVDRAERMAKVELGTTLADMLGDDFERIYCGKKH